MGKITGLGGIFFKTQDPKAIKEWYSKQLGLSTHDWGATFHWRKDDDPEQKGETQWSPFPHNTTYFQPSDKYFMINYRVDDLLSLVEELKQNGVTILDEIAEYEYGKFIHILDPENNKIELWEPKAE